jgi:ABC-type branched-subunit amino acid transport system ATPase component
MDAETQNDMVAESAGALHTACYHCLKMPAVEIASVTKTFGSVTAADDLTLTVPEGSVYGFIGPNGSGKPTTMRMIVNIFYPDSGPSASSESR